MADAVPGGGSALKAYWLTGPGSLKIRWGVSGDFDRCVRAVTKAVVDDGRAISTSFVKGYCSNLHLAATGARPGKAPGEQVGKA